jgi:uncharacterized protein (TIGR02757 family)
MVIFPESFPESREHREKLGTAPLLRGPAARDHLEALVQRFHVPEGPHFDPIGLVRPYRDARDQEVVGLLAALLAYGRVASIQRAVSLVLQELGSSPSESLRTSRHRDRRFAHGFQYRWTTRSDLVGLLEAMAQMQRRDGGLGEGLRRRAKEAGDFRAGLARWAEDLRSVAADGEAPSRSLRFLLPDPEGPGACKRLHLYLRWMIRPDDGIDLGTWSGLLSSSELTIPLDTHWARMGPRLGFTSRRIPDRAMAREITASLRAIDPVDPLRFDFPICHLGIRGHCPADLTVRHCLACPLAPVCATGTRRIARRQARGRVTAVASNRRDIP